MPKFLTHIDMNGNCINNAVIPEVVALQEQVDSLTQQIALLVARMPRKAKAKTRARKRKRSVKSRV